MRGWVWLTGLACVALGLVVGTPARTYESAKDDSFTFVLLPDTQYYSALFPDIFKSQTSWIAKNLASQNIKLVLGLGDIVDDGRESKQWKNADAAVKLIDGKIPYFLAIGNHDYDYPNGGISKYGRLTKSYSKYFGPARHLQKNKGNGYVGPMSKESPENFYSIVNVAGHSYLIVALEFAPSDRALQWANQLVSAHPDKEVIVITHAYVNRDDTLLTLCDNHSKEIYKITDGNNGDEMWEKFVRRHANIKFVLSGHIATTGPGKRADLGDHGNLVNQVLVDYQGLDMGGGGYLRLMKIVPSANRIEMSTYSPYLDKWWRDTQNEFVLDYSRPENSAGGSAVIRGKVKKASFAESCPGVAGVKISYPGGSVVTDAKGAFEFTVQTSARYEKISVRAEKTGWASSVVEATARAGAVYDTELYLSSH